MIIISDIHGSYNSLKALIKKCPKQDVIIAGDMIDRGQNTKDLIKYIRSEGYQVVMGNHELMAINSTNDPMTWLFNGGYSTLASYNIATYPVDVEHLDKDFFSDLNWLKTLPYFLSVESLLDENNRKLVVTHGSCINQYPFNDLSNKDEEDLVWNRNTSPSDIEGVFNVFGHTPQRDILLANHYALIDTGCSYPGYGKLSAFIYPEKDIITQDCID